MERIILLILLAFGLYQIDEANLEGFIWIIVYMIFGILYLRQIKKIDALLGIKKTTLAKINNFLLNISLIILLLIIIYGVNGASLGEGRLLDYSIIEYPMFIVFLFPLFLGIQIFFTRRYFNAYKRVNMLTFLYIVSSIYLWKSRENLIHDTLQ